MHGSAVFSSFLSLQTTAAAPEVVRRPDPGIGRGIWEGPPWLFWAVAAAAVVVAALYGAHRLGWVKLDRLRRRRAEAAPPRSSRTSIAPPSGGRR